MLQLAPERLIDSEALDLLDFLDGHVEGYGVVEDLLGRLRERVHVVMRGSRAGERIVVDETLTYSSGHVERRQWQLARDAAGRIRGRAGGIEGEIVGAESGGSAVLSYGFRLPVGRISIAVRVRDAFHRINERVVVDRTVLRKWGVKLAEISLVYEKRLAGA